LGCGDNGTHIIKAIVYDKHTGAEKILNSEEIRKLNKVLNEGIIEAEGAKWMSWKNIKAELVNRNKITIILYRGGYLKILERKKYYEVRSSFKAIFYARFI